MPCTAITLPSSANDLGACILRLWSRGLSRPRIAAELGCTAEEVRRVLRRAPPRPRARKPGAKGADARLVGRTRLMMMDDIGAMLREYAA